MAIVRTFVGWEKPLLQSVAERLLPPGGDPDLSNNIVLVPVSRASRRLTELLAERAAMLDVELVPPRFISTAELFNFLLLAPQKLATDTERLFALVAALNNSAADDLSLIASNPPARAGLSYWLGLARTVRTLFEDLVAGAKDFDAAAVAAGEMAGEIEAARWRLLARIHSRYLQALEHAERTEPQQLRLDALRDHSLLRKLTQRLIVVGGADLPPIAGLLLEAADAEVETFIFAPPEFAPGFDARGLIAPRFWSDQSVDFKSTAVHVADNHGSERACVAEALQALSCDAAVDEVVVGVVDEQAVVTWEQGLETFGIHARAASGSALALSAAGRLLRALAEYIQFRSFKSLGTLCRQPLVEAYLARTAIGVRDGIVETLDRYQREHLQGALIGPLPQDKSFPAAAIYEAVEKLLSGLPRKAASLLEWCRGLSHVVLELCATRTFSRGRPDDYSYIRLFEFLRRTLEGAAEVTEALMLPLEAADFCAIIADTLASERLPPISEEPRIEILGWLELLFDDSPYLIITEFNDGIIPAAVSSDQFLPHALRVALGVPDNTWRYARDLYVLRALLASRTVAAITAARRDQRGDPVNPSQLLYACPASELAQRIQRYFPAEGTEDASGVEPSLRHGGRTTLVVPPHVRPRRAPLERVAITTLREYLESPYLFYLRHVEKLKPLHDRYREMEADIFGTLAHELFADFGRDGIAESTDARLVEEWLLAELEKRSQRKFGDHALPAVAFQLLNLKERLRIFARWQASWRTEGWKIVAVEQELSGDPCVIRTAGVSIVLTGKIDRIDRHERSGEFVIFDYKSGDKAAEVMAAHQFPDGRWKNLQLPLYLRLFARGAVPSLPPPHAAVRAAYVRLPADLSEACESFAEWSEQEIENAWKEAEATVAAIVREEFPLADGKIKAPEFDALMGQGQLVVEDDSDEAA